MLNIVIPLLIGAGVFAGAASLWDFTSAVVLAPIATIVVFILLSRRIRNRLDPAMKEVEAHIKAQRFDRAIASLEAIRPLGKWQPLLTRSVDAQVGILRYTYQRDFEGAVPFLQRAPRGLWQPWAMLAANHYRKKQYDDMVQVFERATRRNKKEPLLWSAYAWCEWKRGRIDEAIGILARAQQRLPKEERIKNQLQGLQNGKKMKMHSWGPEWMALHLDGSVGPAPPTGGRPGGYTPPMSAYGKGARFRRMG
jgi:tetratricopeptide (TPR) repeat protein